MTALVAWADGSAAELFPVVPLAGALPPPVRPSLLLSLDWAATLGLAGTTIWGLVK